jgi:Zn-finger nucleic acid-binding protein
VKVDECAGCKGIWFDEDELRKTKDHIDSDLNWMDFELWKHDDRFHVATKPIKCPKCDVEMVGIDYGKTQVEVDYCPQCEGVWLDSGEFEKIIDALTEELETKDITGYLKATVEEAREIISGPEGFISEWKDFLNIARMLQYRVLTENPQIRKILSTIQKMSPFR